MTTSSPTFAISVDPRELHFNAAHFITFDNSCENLHGHNFHVRGENDSSDLVVDFVLLTRLTAAICARLNDKVLLPVSNTTAEMLPWYLGERLLEALRQQDAAENVGELVIAVEEADRQWGVCYRMLKHGK